MARFEIEANGKRYEVEAPDMQAAMTALRGGGQSGPDFSQTAPMTNRPQLQTALDNKAFQQRTGGTVADIARGGLAGVGQAAEMLAGTGGDIANAGTIAGRWLGDRARQLMGKAPFTPAQEEAARAGAWKPLPSTNDIAGAVNKFAPKAVSDAVNYQPETSLGKFARTGTAFATASAIGGPRAMLSSIPSAVASEGLGQLTEGTSAEPYARLAGAVLGPVAANAARRAVTPMRIPAHRQAAVNTLHNEGVTELTPGQVTGNNKMRYTESELGGARIEAMYNTQGEQFTSAALRRAGINAPRATSDVIDQGFTRIGGVFDNFAANNNVRLDMQTRRDIHNAVNDFYGNTAPGLRPPVVQEIADGLHQLAASPNPVIAGQTYSSIRSLIGKRVEALRTANPAAAEALRGMQDALDSALERSVAMTNPGAVQAIRDARRQYRNMLVIEKAATAGGEAAASGIISPAHLRTAAKSVMKRGFARGRDEFSALANAGEQVMKPLPNSGTASRLGARRILESGATTALGAAAGYGSTQDSTGAVAGGLAGAFLPWAAGRGLLSRPSRAYLTNQVLPPAPPLGLAQRLNAASIPLRLPSPNSSR